MKRILTLGLAVLMLTCLCACGSDSDKAGDVLGQWETVVYYESDSVEQLLLTMELYEEEIALMDTAGVGFIDVITFREDGTYSMSCDITGTTALVEEYYRDSMLKLYNNRDTLEDIYYAGFPSMSQDGFFQFYAGMYGQESYDALIDLFVSCTVDQEALGESAENGTYQIIDNRIYFTMDGAEDAEAEYVSFVMDSNTLILSFEDGKICYTRK